MVSYILKPEDYDNTAAIQYEHDRAELMRAGKPTPLSPAVICENLKLEYAPKRNREPKFLGGLGSGFSSGVFVVNSEFRKLVEQVEPRTHEFWPLNVTTRSGKALQSKYYLFNIMSHIDALIMKESCVTWHYEKSSPEIFGDLPSMHLKVSDEPHALTFSRERIEGHHIWIGATVLKNKVFVSRNFVDELRSSQFARFFDLTPENVSDEAWDFETNLGEYSRNFEERRRLALRYHSK